jgi:hypothetical protein
MSAQLDFCDLETAALKELMRQAHAAYLMRQQTAGAGSLTNSAGAGDNVVRHPALQSPPPIPGHGSQGPAAPQLGQVGAVQAPAVPHHGQGAQTPAVSEAGEVKVIQVPGTLAKDTLDRLAKEAIRKAENDCAAYDKRACRVGKWSRLVRLLAIVFGVLGGVCPLLPALVTILFGASQGMVTRASQGIATEASQGMVTAQAFFGTLGLVFFALAGSCLLLDKGFGYSSSWMRYRLAELRLRKLIRKFDIEVETELAMCGGTSLSEIEARSLFATVKNFVEGVDDINIEETQIWIAEFKAGLLQIEQYSKGPARPAQELSTRSTSAAQT